MMIRYGKYYNLILRDGMNILINLYGKYYGKYYSPILIGGANIIILRHGKYHNSILIDGVNIMIIQHGKYCNPIIIDGANMIIIQHGKYYNPILRDEAPNCQSFKMSSQQAYQKPSGGDILGAAKPMQNFSIVSKDLLTRPFQVAWRHPFVNV